nr:glycosyl transferase [Saprospiraceae bacterium]
MKAKKILIIRFSSIGDVVLTTPIVRCVKKQLDAEIHFLIKPSFAHVIHENPYIDHIHHLKENIQDTIDILKAEQFDLVIDLQKNLRSYKICSALSCKTIRF